MWYRNEAVTKLFHLMSTSIENQLRIKFIALADNKITDAAFFEFITLNKISDSDVQRIGDSILTGL